MGWMIFDRTRDFYIIHFGKYGFSFTSMECNILKEKEGKLVKCVTYEEEVITRG
jgi:hypothetical protein